MFKANNFSRTSHNLKLQYLMQLFTNLTVKYHYSVSILGFFLLMVFISQIYSGIMLSYSLIPECMLVPIVRDEEDLEDLYTDDFF
jgi:hypothetical protein